VAKVVLINKHEIEKELEIAGWMASVSTDSEADYTKITKHCINSNHGTPTRAMRFMFEISEVSRAFSHEFVRHEIGVGKVQRSQRYVSEDGFKFVTPRGIAKLLVPVTIPLYDSSGSKYGKGEVITYLGFDEFQDIVKQMYNGYVSQGAKPEDARYVLTNATFTKLHVCFDWEGLENFCFRRMCNRAQWEIRDVANQCRDEVMSINTFLGNKLGAPCDKYVYCPEVKGCGIAPTKESIFEDAYRWHDHVTCKFQQIN
jgi:thymidylate synthase (FAD)